MPVTAARADGDPASDVLLGTDVFYPYTPQVSRSLARDLDAAAAASSRHGRPPVRVALIAAPTDLGVVPSLFGRPQQYASFLAQEISFAVKPRLLVVMASGYGTHGLDAAARRAVATLPPPAGKSSNALAAAALVAVQRIAAADGDPLSGNGGAGGGGGGAVLPIALAAVAVILAALLIAARLRRGRA
jgi:hypothetical protein